MKIRSITYFCNPGWPLEEKAIQIAGNFLGEARTAFEEAGFEVQTTRLATIPFPEILGEAGLGDTIRLATDLSRMIQSMGVDFAALGPALPGHLDSYTIIPDAISASENIFFSGILADRTSGISLEAVRRCAEIIVRCARITPDGFANLRFAALANVPPGAPFFPAAYHQGDIPAFALATEAADLAVQAFEGASSVDKGQKRLVIALQENAARMQAVADLLKYRYGARFGGIDLSLAPFPVERRSLGMALEQLGVPALGMHGSLAAAAILADAIDRARFPRAGFSGLMLPVLEDAVLARRAAEETLSIKDLLLYSAVCGTGLDTIPLPGDLTPDEIAPLLLDLAALALRLDKPLTARLMPIPGKQAGDPTDFDFAFFANSKVMSLDRGALALPLGGGETIHLSPRKRYADGE
ncbi:MAG: DUF711 family protein [Chloroflexota bacterium]